MYYNYYQPLTKLIATFFNDNEIDIYDGDIFLSIQQFRLLFHNLDQNQKSPIKVFFHFVLTNELKDAKDIDKYKNYINDNSKCLWDFETIQCWADIVDDNVAILKRIIDVPTITTNWIDALRYFNLSITKTNVTKPAYITINNVRKNFYHNY